MIPNAKKGTFSANEIVMYLSVVLKHLRLALLLVCASVLVGLNYYCYSRVVYHARSLVKVQSLQRPIDTETIFHDSTENLVRRQFSSQSLLLSTAKRLGAPANVNMSELERKYLKKITIIPDSDGNLIVDVWPYSKEIARVWTQTMVSEYLRSREEKRIEYRQAFLKSYTEDMAVMKKKMDDIFDMKANYHDTNELTQILIELNQLKEVPREIFVVKHRLGIIDRTKENLNNPQFDAVAKLSLLSSVEKDLEQVSVGQIVPSSDLENAAAKGTRPEPGIIVVPADLGTAQSKRWDEMDKELRVLKERYAELAAQKLLPGHPKMMAVSKQIDATNRLLEMEVETAVRRLDIQQASLKDKLVQLEAKLPAYNEISRRHQKALREYNTMDAGQLAWNSMFNDMQKKMEALDFGGEKERSSVQFMYHLELQDGPVAPNRMKIMMMCVLAGLALGIAVPFLIEYLNVTVTNVEQAEETLHIRGLGVVPMLEAGQQQQTSLLESHAEADYHLQENFRLIRTNLILNTESPTLPQQLIMVTSAMRQEGKSTVASNLAMSFAQKGERVLLIDADLRRGRLHRAFNCDGKPGLSDVLRERAKIEETFRSTSHPNLTLITCGKHLNTAPELLGNAAFTKIIEDLRTKYDRIILDTPPVLGLAESAILQKVADAVVFVIWTEFTSMRNVKAALQALQLSNGKFVGFVLNRFDFRALGNRYQYFYYAPNYYANYKVIEAPSA